MSKLFSSIALNFVKFEHFQTHSVDSKKVDT